MKQAMQMTLSAVAVALALSGCATDNPQAKTAAAAPAAATATAKELYVVLPETGRIHAFGDTKNYFDFLKNGEVTLTRTQIGAGPGGKTVVYGINGDDVKQNKPSLGELVFQEKLAPAADFHGEVFKDGRFYVFNDMKDMMAFVAYGEVPYSFTDVGLGPKGETLVWVMNKDSIKKGRPLATIERFKKMREAKA